MRFNRHGVWAIYHFELARFRRTLWQSLMTPVITTSLYFIVFGSAIGSRMGDIGGVLRGDHNVHDLDRPAILVTHRDLRLRVGAQPGQAAITAQIGLALDQAMRVVDRCRHEHWSFFAGVSEHQPLIPSSL